MKSTHSLSPRRWLAPAAAALLFVGCTGGSITENKLIGSWAVDAPLPKTIVYTFHTNHTYAMQLSGESGGVVGTWKLNENQLVTAMGAVSNKFGSKNIFGTINTSSTNRISKLTDAVMVWREVGELKGTKLKRVAAVNSER